MWSVRTALLGLLVIAGVLAACNDDGNETGPNVAVEPQATQQRAAPGQGDVRSTTIEINDDGVDPQQVRLTASQPIQLEVVNNSSETCAFFMGGFVSEVTVPAGETVENSVTLPTGNEDETVQMGCKNDPQRQGSAIVEFKGLAPQPGNEGGQ